MYVALTYLEIDTVHEKNMVTVGYQRAKLQVAGKTNQDPFVPIRAVAVARALGNVRAEGIKKHSQIQYRYMFPMHMYYRASNCRQKSI